MAMALRITWIDAGLFANTEMIPSYCQSVLYLQLRMPFLLSASTAGLFIVNASLGLVTLLLYLTFSTCIPNSFVSEL